MQIFYATIVLYNSSQSLVKISILLQYLRIFETTYMKRICYVALVISFAYATGSIGISLFPCTPVSALWDKSVSGKCLPILPWWITSAILNIVTDFGIFILPLPILVHLQVRLRQKIVLLGVFMVGFWYKPPVYNPFQFGQVF
jgi:hypothetical protein